MGTFFTNLHLRFEDTERAAAAVEDALPEGAAFVSEPAGGWISVYPEAAEDQGGTLEILAADLSRELSCACLALLVHDDDLLLLWLHESGELRDAYNSRPDYWEPTSREEAAASSGRPEVLATVGTAEAGPEEIGEVLDRDASFEYGEQERVEALARLLGIDPDRALTGHTYLVEEGYGEDFGPLHEVYGGRRPRGRDPFQDPHAAPPPWRPEAASPKTPGKVIPFPGPREEDPSE